MYKRYTKKRLHFETCGSGESLVCGSKQSFATTGLGRYLICGSEKRLRSDLRFVVRRNVKLSQSAFKLGSQTRLVTSGICNHLSCSLVRQISPVILTAYLRCDLAARLWSACQVYKISNRWTAGNNR